MDFLADTVAVIKHLREALPPTSQAARVLQEADRGGHRIYVSAITLMVPGGRAP